MTKKTKKHGRDKLLSNCVDGAPQECLPPEIHDAGLPMPTKLQSVREIREEMARVYRLVWKGKILLADATKLAYYLDKMIQAIKTEAELDAAAEAYAKAWGGVNILTD